MSGRTGLPLLPVAIRRNQLSGLPRESLHDIYRSLPGREHVESTGLADAVIIDIIIWTEFADWNRVEGRGGKHTGE